MPEQGTKLFLLHSMLRINVQKGSRDRLSATQGEKEPSAGRDEALQQKSGCQGHPTLRADVTRRHLLSTVLSTTWVGGKWLR